MDISIKKEQILSVLEKYRSDSLSPENFITQYHPKYIKKMDIDDIEKHYIDILHLLKNRDKTYRYQGDIEHFFIQKFNAKKLYNEWKKMAQKRSDIWTLYRVFISEKKDNIIFAYYKDIRHSKRVKEFKLPDIKKEYKGFISKNGEKKDLKIRFYESKYGTKIDLKIINISRITLIRNVIETFQKNGIFPDFIEMWHNKSREENIHNMFLLSIYFRKEIDGELKKSIKFDFKRYLHNYIKPMSIFDLIGPPMVGPSSSHTAGANKIGQIAKNIFLAIENRENLDQKSILGIEVKLFGSFRDTGIGHKTPPAIGGGLWELDTDDEKMMIMGDPDYLKENGFKIDNLSIPFLGYKRSTVDEDKRYIKDGNQNIVEISLKTEDKNYIVTGFSIGGGNVEIRYFNRKKLKQSITGKLDSYLTKDDSIVIDGENSGFLIKKIVKTEESNIKPSIPFNTFEELINYTIGEKLTLIETVLKVEKMLQNCSKIDIYERMENYWLIMKKSIKKGLNSSTLTPFGLSGDGGYKIDQFLKHSPLFNNIYGLSNAYSTAINEINAKSGLIIACPTAGSCGILPGVVKGYIDSKEKVDNNKVLESLMIAGFLGMILFQDVSTAGADYGCQAEVGAAAAMGAAALTYLEGGDCETVIHGFTLALKNSMGLICDPVAGLVEVPCVKRNGIFSSVAISASLMSLSGIRSFISPDEVVLAMREVGTKLHKDYKETSKGGLAKTRDGKEVENKIKKEIFKFFG